MPKAHKAAQVGGGEILAWLDHCRIPRQASLTLSDTPLGAAGLRAGAPPRCAEPLDNCSPPSTTFSSLEQTCGSPVEPRGGRGGCISSRPSDLPRRLPR